MKKRRLRRKQYQNITYIDGAEMKKGISGYLKVLYDLDPAMVGGNMPDDAFYYETE